MNVIVLGGSGFIGRAVCVKLAEHGFRVTSLSRYGGKNVKEEWKHHPSITWQKQMSLIFLLGNHYSRTTRRH